MKIEVKTIKHPKIVLFFVGAVSLFCGALPLYLAVKFSLTLEGSTIIMSLVFFAFGGWILYGMLRDYIYEQEREKLLGDPDAYETIGRYIPKKVKFTDVVHFGLSFEKIFFEYIDENGVHRIAKSVKGFAPEHAEYLKGVGQFKIRCKGKYTAIIEDLPGKPASYVK